MSKLFLLKKWFSIEDASKKLSLTFGEDVSMNDVLQLVLDGELDISWYIPHSLAVEIIYENVLVLSNKSADEYLQASKPIKYIEQFRKSVISSESFRVYTYHCNDDFFGERRLVKDYKQVSKRLSIDGVFKLHLHSGLIKVLIEDWIFGKNEEYIHGGYGEVLENENGVLHMLIDPSIDEENKASNLIDDWRHPPYNSLRTPKLEELVVSANDLNNFINSINPTTQKIDIDVNFKDSITTTNTWNSLYKQTEKAVDAFPTWQNNQPKPNNIPVSHIDEWLAVTQKIKTREAEIIKKIIQDIFNL